MEDAACRIPVVAEDEAEAEGAEGVPRLLDQANEEVDDQREDRRGEHGQPPLEDPIGKPAGRRPLEGRAAGGDGGGAGFHLDRVPTRSAIHCRSSSRAASCPWPPGRPEAARTAAGWIRGRASAARVRTRR